MKIKSDNESRQGIMVPKSIQLAFKSKAGELGKKLGRTVTQVELVERVGSASVSKLLELF